MNREVKVDCTRVCVLENSEYVVLSITMNTDVHWFYCQSAVPNLSTVQPLVWERSYGDFIFDVALDSDCVGGRLIFQ